MHLLIVANNAEWKTFNDKITEIRNFYASVFDLPAVSVKYTSHQNVPYQGNIPEPQWYADNVLSLATGYDFVIFLDPNAPISATQVCQGCYFGEVGTCSKICLYVQEDWRMNAGQDYNSFVLQACHEISHAMYAKIGMPDRTHEFFYNLNPQGVLPDFQNYQQKEVITLAKVVVNLLQNLIAWYHQ